MKPMVTISWRLFAAGSCTVTDLREPKTVNNLFKLAKNYIACLIKKNLCTFKVFFHFKYHVGKFHKIV